MSSPSLHLQLSAFVQRHQSGILNASIRATDIIDEWENYQLSETRGRVLGVCFHCDLTYVKDDGEGVDTSTFHAPIEGVQCDIVHFRGGQTM